MKQINMQKGYTLLFAVLTAVLVLGVAVFIVGVARKQYNLIATARDSTVALYNADSAVSCVVQTGVGNALTFSIAAGTTLQVPCNMDAMSGNVPTVTFAAAPNVNDPDVPGYNPGYRAAFREPQNRVFDPGSPLYQSASTRGDGYLYIPLESGCALVRIWRGKSKDDPTLDVTAVKARGYTICSATLNGPVLSYRNVERAMQFIVK